MIDSEYFFSREIKKPLPVCASIILAGAVWMLFRHRSPAHDRPSRAMGGSFVRIPWTTLLRFGILWPLVFPVGDLHKREGHPVHATNGVAFSFFWMIGVAIVQTGGVNRYSLHIDSRKASSPLTIANLATKARVTRPTPAYSGNAATIGTISSN